MRPVTPEQQLAHWERGHGHGEGADYKPWIRTRDFTGSRGVRVNIKGQLHGRMHACLSGLEAGNLLLAQRLPGIVDAREQFPLPLEATDAIAARLGIAPLAFRGNPVRVTTDLLLTFENGGRRRLAAVALKPAEQLEDERTLEKLTVEYLYWTAMEEEWFLVTDRELTAALVKRLRWLDQHSEMLDMRLPAGILSTIEHSLLPLLRTGGDEPLNEVCLGLDDRLGLEPGLCLTAFRHFVGSKRWLVRLSSDIEAGKPFRSEIRVPVRAGEG